MSTRATHNYGKPLNNIPRLSTDKPQPNEVTTYHMEPKDIEAYLIKKYGIKKLMQTRSSEDSTKYKPLSEDMMEYHRKRGGFGG